MLEKIKGLGARIRKTRSLWLIGGIVLLAAGGFGAYRWLNSSDQLTYLTSPAVKGTITDAIQATGTLEPVRKVGLSFKSVQTVTVLNVKAGDRVTEGQVLAEQDTRELRAQFNQAERDVAQNEAQIKVLNMTIRKAEKNLKQQEELFAAGVSSQDELDQARDDYEKAQIDLASAEAQLETSRAKLEIASNDLEATVLVAPFAGIVSAVNGDVGQRSGGGSGSDVNAFITLISDELQINTMINEVDMGRIKVGQDVEFTTSAYSGKTFRGRVTKISPEATTVSNVQFYQSYISVEDPERLLYPGMSAAVNVIVARKADVLNVPMIALTYAESYIKSSGQGAAGSGPQTAVRSQGKPAATDQSGGNAPSDRKNNPNQRRLVVLENEQPVVKTVVVGLSDGQNMEIVEGLNPGDKVIVGTNSAASTSAGTGAGANANRQSGQQFRQPGGGMIMIR